MSLIFRGCKRDACEVNHTDSELVGEDMMILDIAQLVRTVKGRGIWKESKVEKTNLPDGFYNAVLFSFV